MSDEQLQIMRHSAAHLVAAAVQKLYPGAKFGVGPVVENGFYYDIEFSQNISEADLKTIEKQAKKMSSQNLAFERKEMSIGEAVKLFESLGQTYKVSLLNDIKTKGTTKVSDAEMQDLVGAVDMVSVYQTGEFVDLCRGPHVTSSKEIVGDGLKLTKLAGAYWRGDEKNKMLTRIYGVVFPSGAELKDYLDRVRLAEERDHRKLGKELELFVFSDLVGPGMPLFTFRGAIVRQEIIDYINSLQKGIGYQTVHTPNLNKAELFKISGHYDKYKDDMLMVKSHYSDEEYFLKPMNCPQHTQIYASQMRSYRDLPIRIADFANLYRDERPGELNGLSRLRCFCQDDAHCFCREDQIEDEFSAVLGIIEKALQTFGMKYWIRLSLRDPKQPEKYLGGDEVWNKAETLLEGILQRKKIEYKKAEGEAAFYGPKMDIMVRDALGREWQISTIQVDFNMPVRFDLKYIDKDGAEKTPVMIHRAIIGSPERFMGILIEHYGGAFPTWLAPVQVQLITVSPEKHGEGALKLKQELVDLGVRVGLDDANETLGNRVRKAVGQKVPYIIAVGDKELGGEEWMIRMRGQEKQEQMSKEKFIERILAEIKERK